MGPRSFSRTVRIVLCSLIADRSTEAVIFGCMQDPFHENISHLQLAAVPRENIHIARCLELQQYLSTRAYSTLFSCPIPRTTMLHLVLLSLLVPLTASYCPFPGPVLPPPTHISTSKSFQSAIQNLTSYLSSPTTDLGFARNETTFSILLTDAEKPIWEYHHTTPASIVGNITVGRHSQYRVGSVSKVFADLLLLRLGLDLNTPVTKWLPGLREGLGGVDWDAITLKDLGSHMAGIRRDYGFWVENYTAAPLFQQVGLPPAIKEKYLPCEVEGLQDQPCTDARGSSDQQHRSR